MIGRPRTAALALAGYALLAGGAAAPGAAAQVPSPSAADDAPATVWIYLVEPVDGGDAAQARKAAEQPATGTLASAPRRRLPDVFGCGDRLVALAVPQSEPQPTGDGDTATVAEPSAAQRITAALEAQLAAATVEPPPGLIDALQRTTLRVVAVELVPESGTDAWGNEAAEATTDEARAGIYRVRLAGRLEVEGACDVPRLRAQLTAAATQFDDVEEVELFLGDEPLDAVLSLRGLAAGR